MRPVTAVLLLTAALGVTSPFARQDDSLRARAHRLHRDAIVVDTHADLTPFIELDTRVPLIGDPGMAGKGYDPAGHAAAQPVLPTDSWYNTFPKGPWRFTDRHADGYMDLPRMREGGLDAEFFSIYMEEEPRPGMAVRRALDQIEAVRALCAKYPTDVALAARADDVVNIVKSGRIAALMGLEGGHMIEDDLRALHVFSDLGVRYMSITHAFNTDWADSSGVGPPLAPTHDGLSPFGRAVVEEMNRLGMLVDVSHGGDKTFWDVLAVTKAPIIASHSGCRAVKNHPRNMSDDMLRALAKNGGVIQIDAVTKYINPAIPVISPRSRTRTRCASRRRRCRCSSTTSRMPSRWRAPTTSASASTSGMECRPRSASRTCRSSSLSRTRCSRGASTRRRSARYSARTLCGSCARPSGSPRVCRRNAAAADRRRNRGGNWCEHGPPCRRTTRLR